MPLQMNFDIVATDFVAMRMCGHAHDTVKLSNRIRLALCWPSWPERLFIPDSTLNLFSSSVLLVSNEDSV